MRAILTASAVVVALVALFALFGPSHPDAASSASTAEAAAPTTTAGGYGPAVGADGTQTSRAEADPVVDGEELPAPTSTAPSATSSTTTSTAAVQPAADEGGLVVSEATTLVEDLDVDGHGHDHGHLEEEPDDEFPDLEPGQYPVSSNLADGVEYPLRAMVEIAVELLDAEVTGANRDDYPHLAELVSVCCEGLEVDGAAVLFGATQADPATIIIDWHADAAGDEQRLVRGSTRTRWFFRDGTWVGEHDAHLDEE